MVKGGTVLKLWLVLRREDLTLLLRRAKIVLNLHYYPAKVLEICRIVEAISFGAMVRSMSRICTVMPQAGA